MRSVSIVCLACVIISTPLSAQGGALSGSVESNRSGLGSHVRVFLGGESALRSGFEVGYSSLGRAVRWPLLGAAGTSAGFRLKNSRLWHAGPVARRAWNSLGRNSGLYAVAGAGVYLSRFSTERMNPAEPGNLTGMTLTGSQTYWAFGANLGAGIQLPPTGLPGALGIDARLHVLPFSHGFGPRTVITVSAGLSFF